MTVKELQARVDRLIPRPIMVLCKLPDGSETEITANEFISRDDVDFIRLAEGNDLRQVAAILDKLAGGDKCVIN